jgi:acyl transferase domain-containing protein
MPEPIAIVGMAALYPEARDVAAFWDLLTRPALRCQCAEEAPADTAGWRRCGHAAASGPGSGLDDVRVDLAQFGIPPAQAASMTRLQVLMLHAARQCLDDAGAADRELPRDTTDVLVATCGGLDRQYANALRVEATRYARSVRRALEAGGEEPSRAEAAAAELLGMVHDRLGVSSHDRVGEMASTIPARIAAAFSLRGRTLTVEAADASSFVALAHAITTLRSGACDATLVLAGQRRESSLLAAALTAKGVLTGRNHPFADGGDGFALGEGVGAVLLKRCSSAVRDGDRVYALIRDCALYQEPRPGTFRYSTSAQQRRAAAALAYQGTGVDPSSIQYVECVGAGTPAETRAELAALAAILADPDQPPVLLGSVKDRLGHTFANAGLASVTKMALALHHRTVPPQWLPGRLAGIDLPPTRFRVPSGPVRWRPGRAGGPRRAAVDGASLTGTLCHLVMEEHDPGRASAGPAVTAAPAPIAIVAAGARFAGPPGAAGFARTVQAGQDQIRALPPERLDRELFHRPGGLSLTHSYTDLGAVVEAPREAPAELAITPARLASMDDAQRLALAVASELFGPWGEAARTLSGPGMVALGSTLCLATERSADAARQLHQIEAAICELDELRALDEDERAALRKLAREEYGETLCPGGAFWLDGFLASGSAAAIANEYRLAAVPVAVEAACASSLAAIDLAVGALRSAAIDFAVAGGVELACTERDLVLCSALGLLSRSRITPFDVGADGFSPGDGCALFLLKRRDDAVRDGDRVLGLIRGIGAANDAKSLIAPDTGGQALAMRRAFSGLEFGPEAVDYLEAHGTGTKVGDQIEVEAISAIYACPRRHRPMAIGSAKSFFGHTFAAAGGAGLLRAVQAIGQRTLPPSANLATLNPALGLSRIPAFVPTQPVPWPAAAGHPRRAAVSSFGTGGINYHLLIEENRDGSDGL